MDAHRDAAKSSAFVEISIDTPFEICQDQLQTVRWGVVHDEGRIASLVTKQNLDDFPISYGERSRALADLPIDFPLTAVVELSEPRTGTPRFSWISTNVIDTLLYSTANGAVVVGNDSIDGIIPLGHDELRFLRRPFEEALGDFDHRAGGRHPDQTIFGQIDVDLMLDAAVSGSFDTYRALTGPFLSYHALPGSITPWLIAVMCETCQYPNHVKYLDYQKLPICQNPTPPSHMLDPRRVMQSP